DLIERLYGAVTRRSATAGVRVKPVKWQHFPALSEQSPEQWFANVELGSPLTVTFDKTCELPWVAEPFPPGPSNYATPDEAKAALEAHRESRILSALDTPAVEAEPDWRDDPSADERWNAGLDFAMQQLCSFLGVD